MFVVKIHIVDVNSNSYRGDMYDIYQKFYV